MNELNIENIGWILDEVAECELEQFELGTIEIFGEAENGNDCSAEIEITAICKKASEVIKNSIPISKLEELIECYEDLGVWGMSAEIIDDLEKLINKAKQ